MTRIFALAAAFAFTSSMALADLAPETLATTYQNNGYTNIEVKVGATQLKIEAIKDNVKIEATYDIATGEIVKSETHAVQAGTTITTTTEIQTDGDSADSSDDGDTTKSNDDGADHDSGDDHGNDNGSDDNHDGGHDGGQDGGDND